MSEQDHFPMTIEGYQAARAWLEKIGEWEYVSTHGFSTDGWSITATANVLWKERHPEEKAAPEGAV